LEYLAYPVLLHLALPASALSTVAPALLATLSPPSQAKKAARPMTTRIVKGYDPTASAIQ
jgi:hypothetical protein